MHSIPKPRKSNNDEDDCGTIDNRRYGSGSIGNGDGGYGRLDIRDLRTYFYTRRGVAKAVDGVDLQVGENEVVGMVGESGCGKTTVAFSIMKLIQKPGRIVGGEIRFRDVNLLNLTEVEMRQIRGKDIAMVFQDPMTFLNPVLTIGDQIAETILKHDYHQDLRQENRQSGDDSSFRRGDIESRVVEALELVSMPSPRRLIKYYPHQLSGGMRQRVLISIALACNPSVLIADEPTTALDVTLQAQILDLMKELQRRLGLSILLITHNLGIVAEICDRVAVMYAGKVVEKGDVNDILDRPVHPYTVALLDSILTISKVKQELKSIDGNVPDLVNPPTGCRFSPRCPRVMDICHTHEPVEVGIEKNHQVSCWLYS